MNVLNKANKYGSRPRSHAVSKRKLKVTNVHSAAAMRTRRWHAAKTKDIPKPSYIIMNAVIYCDIILWFVITARSLSTSILVVILYLIYDLLIAQLDLLKLLPVATTYKIYLIRCWWWLFSFVQYNFINIVCLVLHPPYRYLFLEVLENIVYIVDKLNLN